MNSVRCAGSGVCRRQPPSRPRRLRRSAGYYRLLVNTRSPGCGTRRNAAGIRSSCVASDRLACRRSALGVRARARIQQFGASTHTFYDRCGALQTKSATFARLPCPLRNTSSALLPTHRISIANQQPRFRSTRFIRCANSTAIPPRSGRSTHAALSLHSTEAHQIKHSALSEP